MTEFLIGIVCGAALALLFSFGPAFFGLIQNSIHYGFRRAMSFVIGVNLSDIFIVFLMLTVLRNLNMEAVLHNVYVASIGSLVIAFIGIHSFSRKAVAVADNKGNMHIKADGNMKGWQLMLHGFALNFFNPMLWLYWVTIITVLSAEVGLGLSERYIFFLGLLLADLGINTLKCRLSAYLQAWFTPKIFSIFSKVMGAILIGIAGYLLVSMILYQTSPSIREKEQNNNVQSTRIIQTLHNQINKDSAKQEVDTAYFE